MTTAIIIQHYINFYVLLYFCVQWVYQSLKIVLHLHISKLDSQTPFRKKPVYLNLLQWWLGMPVTRSHANFLEFYPSFNNTHMQCRLNGTTVYKKRFATSPPPHTPLKTRDSN